MPADNTPLIRRLITLGILLVALLVLLTVNSTQRSYRVATTMPSYSPPLLNAAVAQNWLPPTSYNYFITKLDNYLKTNSLAVSTMSVQGNVSVDRTNGTYNFTLLFQPQGRTHTISVTVQNYNGVISTAVAIDGQSTSQQTPPTHTTNPTTNNPTQFDGFDGLINEGVTSDQANNLQTAFLKFAPKAATITIGVTNSRHIIDPNTGANTYTFSVKIDSKQYNASMNAPGLSSIELFLTDPQSGKQVFDSHTIGD